MGKRFLTKINAKENPLFLNRSNGYSSYQTNKGTVPVLDVETGIKLRCSKDDPKLLSGEYQSLNKFRKLQPRSEKSKQKLRDLYKDDDYLQKHKNKMKIAMNNSNTIEKLKRGHKEEICYKCGIKMKRPAITNYHNDNCGKKFVPAKGRSWYNDGVNSFMLFENDPKILLLKKGRI